MCKCDNTSDKMVEKLLVNGFFLCRFRTLLIQGVMLAGTLVPGGTSQAIKVPVEESTKRLNNTEQNFFEH